MGRGVKLNNKAKSLEKKDTYIKALGITRLPVHCKKI